MKSRRSDSRVVLGAFVALLLLASAVLIPERTSSQSLDGGLWQDIAEGSIVYTGKRDIVPAAYRAVQLDKSALTQLIAQAPQEFTAAARQSQTVLSVPLPDGKTGRFRIENSPIMESGLAARHPEIKTFRGQGIDDPTATARFGLTSAGFHGIILSAGDTVYIDPYAKGDAVNHISYFKRSLAGDKRFECHIGDLNNKAGAQGASVEGDEGQIEGSSVSAAGTLRTYRLAMAATGEYVMHFSEILDSEEVKKDKALTAMVATMNRVNGVYERELSVRMIFVNNTRGIIFTNPVADPYTNNPVQPVDMLVENQVTCDTLIGEDNYDIGHVVSTGFGGVAWLEAVCDKGEAGVPGDGFNAGGFTGLDNPVGDGFDIDFVAHEMGHQFGGNHTFNGTDGSCGGNEGAASAYEPGSGTTIQAYAGICATQDLQPHSDDYFHVKSLEEMVAFIRGGGNGCSVRTTVDNAAPIVNAGPDYNIPANTPFTLTATGSDPDGNPLTYTWEEYDLGPSAPAGGNGDNDNDNQPRPIFRSYKGTTNPSRTFPSLKYILNNGNTPPATYDCGRAGEPCITGEDLPSMTRTMQFQVTARDNRAVGGGINLDVMKVNVRGDSGPFVVTQPDAAATWAGRSTQTVTWNVAKTNIAPINTAHVKISLSADGGNTFPHVLAASTPNDGSESVSLPNIATSQARIKVEAVGNIFFDISNADITITPVNPSLSGFLLSTTTAPTTIGSCSSYYTGRVTVDVPAPAGGILVTLTNNNPAANIPASVLVPAGKTTATFKYTGKSVASSVTNTVNASAGGATLTRTLTVIPPRVNLVVLSPNPVKGGNTAEGTVFLQCAAPPGGLPVTLATSAATTAAPTASKIVIPAGNQSATFTVTTKAVTSAKSAYIGAAGGGQSIRSRLFVDP